MTGAARVVVTGLVPRPGLDILRRDGHRVDVWDSEDQQPREQLLEQVEGADALMTLLTEQVDAELLVGPLDQPRAVEAAGGVEATAASARAVAAAATGAPSVTAPARTAQPAPAATA